MSFKIRSRDEWSKVFTQEDDFKYGTAALEYGVKPLANQTEYLKSNLTGLRRVDSSFYQASMGDLRALTGLKHLQWAGLEADNSIWEYNLYGSGTDDSLNQLVPDTGIGLWTRLGRNDRDADLLYNPGPQKYFLRRKALHAKTVILTAPFSIATSNNISVGQIFPGVDVLSNDFDWIEFAIIYESDYINLAYLQSALLIYGGKTVISHRASMTGTMLERRVNRVDLISPSNMSLTVASIGTIAGKIVISGGYF